MQMVIDCIENDLKSMGGSQEGEEEGRGYICLSYHSERGID